MTDVLMFFQAAVSILLIILVLLQFGKGAEAGLFSGGGDSLMTGAQQGNILSKATVVLAILFMGNSVLLARLQGQKAGSSLLDSETPVARPLNSDAAAKPAETEAPKKMEAPAATKKPETK
jgi:preprotein translocase subunit SecG